ncbi:MAG: LapA family protein [Anaerolineales bacterium]|jgi:uncharacterized integral membrane protein
MIFTLILALAFAIVAVIFALQNTEVVTVAFFSLSYEGSLALVILVAVALGILIGVLVMTPGNIRNKISSTRNRKKVSSLEASLDEQKSKLAALEKPVPPESEADELKSPDSQ